MSATAVESHHHDNSDVTGNIKWEDSGIVIGGGSLTPEDETKLLLNSSATDQQQLKPENRDNNIIIGDDNDDDNIKRRSSAGTYSLSSDSQPDCNNAAAAASAWLSDADEGNSTQQRVDVVLLNSDCCTDDRPSVGSSPLAQADTSSPQRKPQRPKVDYQKGIQCGDVLKAMEILLTSYRLPDIVFRQCHRHWSSWANTAGVGSSHDRRHDYASSEAVPQLRQLCVQIERRHLEIAEVLRKLLELDAANRAEADALLRLSEDPATTPVSGGPPGASSRAAGGDDSGTGATTSGGDSGDAPARAGVKRRNPLSRAVSAIRKKFARPQQQEPASIPAAA